MQALADSVWPVILGIFFTFATFMCLAAGWSLLDPTGPAAAIWVVKPDEYRQLLALGPVAGIGFLALAGVMAATGIGCFARKKWGWQLAVAVIAINALADAARALAGDPFEGAVGMAIAGAVLFCLFRPRVRQAFRP